MAPQPQPHPKLQYPARTSLRFPPVRANGIAWHGVTCSHGMYHDMYEHDKHSAGGNTLTLVDPRQLNAKSPVPRPNPRSDLYKQQR